MLSKFSSLLLLFAFTGYSFATFAETNDPLSVSIRKAGKLNVALASVPPYQVVSPKGEATGSTVDLENMVLKSMGLPALTPAFTEWTAMIPGLVTNRFDYVGAGLIISEQGCKAVVYSAPISAAQTGMYVLSGNPKHLTSIADVAHRPDVKLSTIPGANSSSSYLGYLLTQGVKPEQIVNVPDTQAGVATVIGGRVDAFVIGQFTIPNPEQKALEVVVDKGSPVVGVALAFRKEDIRFRDAVNEHLIPLLRDGTIQKLYAKYGIPNGDAVAKLIAPFNKASDLVPGCE
ncbi:hypothetical protein XI07_05600 [Bradyrhizobium sp. CCBAU 11445]|uniref:transporter substrate-binding domain-containing protein n=1 Tax=Bradyrhizobium sp. CCBAU 11445 TaxID=1630896 RepID=UPI0023056F1B|nr:transporter substrate-binding domain-containing protein [Bradyrhizobium sp. CCBAU 11445]MDA9481485.1 hypothetical protein [Bradyrhizobium sp. CCBAU 11445]